MTDTGTPDRSKVQRRIAIILALFWAVLWLVFGLISGAGTGLRNLIVNSPNALPGLLFLVTALVAWRWSMVGGIVLLGEGVFILIAYPLFAHGRFQAGTVVATVVALALPPLVAGLLFVLARRRA
jgi:hypothetical protein